jgi:uracil-DNA glycosylase
LVVADNRLREPLDACFDRIPADWRAHCEPFRHSAAGRALIEFVDARVAVGATVYPAAVFRALELTPLHAVRAVILGQDPYHGPGQAQGLAFSVPPGMKLPPSLRNMRAEIGSAGRLADGDLSPWAAQGVLLLNSALTVEDGAPQSHAGRGWERLTETLIGAVAARAEPVAFLLWGAAAQARRGLIDATRHAVFCANHPSPLSARRPPAPFIGCGHFRLVNEWLTQQHRPDAAAIDW